MFDRHCLFVKEKRPSGSKLVSRTACKPVSPRTLTLAPFKAGNAAVDGRQRPGKQKIRVYVRQLRKIWVEQNGMTVVE